MSVRILANGASQHYHPVLRNGINNVSIFCRVRKTGYQSASWGYPWSISTGIGSWPQTGLHMQTWGEASANTFSVHFNVRGTGVTSVSATGVYLDPDKYYNFTCVNASATDHRLYIGTTKYSGTFNTGSADPVYVTLGGSPTMGENLAGNIADLTIWVGASLTDGEVAILDSGINPTLIRPDKIALYIEGRNSRRDAVSGKDFSPNGSAPQNSTFVEHPFPARYYSIPRKASSFVPKSKTTGSFDLWLTDRLYFRTLPPLNSNTGTFERWITDASLFPEYAAATSGTLDRGDRAQLGLIYRGLFEAAGTTYDDTLTINIIKALAETELATLVPNLNLNAIKTITTTQLSTLLASTTLNNIRTVSPAEIATIEAALTANVIKALSPSGGLLAEKALTLNRTANLTTDELLSAAAALALNRTSALTGATLLTALDELNLQRIATTTYTTTLNAQDATTLNKQLAISNTSIATLFAALNTSYDLAIAINGGLLAEDNLTLSKLITLNATSLATYLRTLTLNRTNAYTQTETAILEALVAGTILQNTLALTPTETATLFKGLTLSNIRTITNLAEVLGAFEEAMTLARDLGLATSEIATLVSAQILAKSLAHNFTTDATINASLLLNALKQIALLGTRTVDNTATLARTHAITATVAAILTLNTALAKTADISTTETATINTLLNLARQQGLSPEELANLETSITLNRIATIAIEDQAIHEIALSLAKSLGLTLAPPSVIGTIITGEIENAVFILYSDKRIYVLTDDKRQYITYRHKAQTA